MLIVEPRQRSAVPPFSSFVRNVTSSRIQSTFGMSLGSFPIKRLDKNDPVNDRWLCMAPLSGTTGSMPDVESVASVGATHKASANPSSKQRSIVR
jgi:hypothetical protein